MGDVEEPEVLLLVLCEITLQSQEFNCREGCFPEGSVDGGRRRKIKDRTGLFLLPLQSMNWVSPFPAAPPLGHFALFPTSCCSMAAAIPVPW